MNIKNKKSNFKIENTSLVIGILFIFYFILRVLMIVLTDGLHEGDAVSRTAGTHHMNFVFNIWPTEIWLPLPFWLVYI